MCFFNFDFHKKNYLLLVFINLYFKIFSPDKIYNLFLVLFYFLNFNSSQHKLIETKNEKKYNLKMIKIEKNINLQEIKISKNL